MIFAVNNVIQRHLEKKLILSVSGGVDSTVLLYILKELNADIVVVHFNHQQRSESIIEAEYVKTLASTFQYPLNILNYQLQKIFTMKRTNKDDFTY